MQKKANKQEVRRRQRQLAKERMMLVSSYNKLIEPYRKSQYSRPSFGSQLFEDLPILLERFKDVAIDLSQILNEHFTTRIRVEDDTLWKENVNHNVSSNYLKKEARQFIKMIECFEDIKGRTCFVSKGVYDNTMLHQIDYKELRIISIDRDRIPYKDEVYLYYQSGDRLYPKSPKDWNLPHHISPYIIWGYDRDDNLFMDLYDKHHNLIKSSRDLTIEQEEDVVEVELNLKDLNNEDLVKYYNEHCVCYYESIRYRFSIKKLIEAVTIYSEFLSRGLDTTPIKKLDFGTELQCRQGVLWGRLTSGLMAMARGLVCEKTRERFAQRELEGKRLVTYDYIHGRTFLRHCISMPNNVYEFNNIRTDITILEEDIMELEEDMVFIYARIDGKLYPNKILFKEGVNNGYYVVLSTESMFGSAIYSQNKEDEKWKN